MTDWKNKLLLLWDFLWRGILLGWLAALVSVLVFALLDLPDLIASPSLARMRSMGETFLRGLVVMFIPGWLGGGLAAIAVYLLLSLARAPRASMAARTLGGAAGAGMGALLGGLILWLFSAWSPEAEPAGLLSELFGYLVGVAIPAAIGASYGWLLVSWVQHGSKARWEP